MIKVDREEIYKAINAQKEYCGAKKLPHFAPTSGKCFSCGREIYQNYDINGRESKGISVQEAGKHFVTGCPQCSRSFCD